MSEQSALYKGTYQDTLKRMSKNYEVARNQKERDVIKQKMTDQMNRAVKLGGVDPEKARESLQKTFEELPMRTLRSDLGHVHDSVKGVEEVRKQLDLGEKGHYQGMAPDKLEAANKLIDSAMSRAEKTVENKRKLENLAADKMVAFKYVHGGMTQDELDKNINKMTPSTYVSISKGLLGGEITQQSHPEAFSKAIDFIADPNNSEMDSFNYLLEAHSLAKMFMIPPQEDENFKLPKRPNLNEMLESQEKQKAASEEKRGIIASLKQFFGSNTKGIKKTIDNVNNEQDPKAKNAPNFVMDQAKKVKAQDFLTKHPEVSSFPKEGKVIGKYRYFPDGSTEEVSQ